MPNTSRNSLTSFSAPGSAGGIAPEKEDIQEVQQILAAQREVFEYMEQGIVVWNAEGICTMVNSRFYELSNLNNDDLYVGMSREDYYNRMIRSGNSDMTRAAADKLLQKIASGKPFSIDRTTADHRILSIVIRPLAKGGDVGTFTDVTAERKQEEILRTAIERAEVAERQAHATLAFEQERKQEVDRLSEFGDWLQSCKTIVELYEVVRQAMIAIYPDSQGQLFIYSNSRDILEGVTTWGHAEIISNIQPQDCWALRRGRLYSYGNGMINFTCHHVHCNHDSDGSGSQDTDQNLTYLCLPIIAHGDTVGLLHIDFSNKIANNSSWDPFCTENLAFATRCAEQVSLAVANVKLRDELHEQTTRDPLTNLFNRRYFLERCRAELSRAEKESVPVSVVVFDADNFKQFNDRFGHDAGDVVLCNIGDLAQRTFCDNQTVARIGGEEFAVLIPDLSVEQVQQLTQNYIDVLASQNINYLNVSLPSVSISAGIATLGTHGNSMTEMMRQADHAMYKAKELGKNRVVIAGE